jgi:hypothetical protein
LDHSRVSRRTDGDIIIKHHSKKSPVKNFTEFATALEPCIDIRTQLLPNHDPALDRLYLNFVRDYMFSSLTPKGIFLIDVLQRSSCASNKAAWWPLDEMVVLRMPFIAVRHAAQAEECSTCGDTSHSYDVCPFGEVLRASKIPRDFKITGIGADSRQKDGANGQKDKRVCRYFSYRQGCKNSNCKFEHICRHCNRRDRHAYGCSRR